ncbi:TRAP transporter large permease subunit [Micropruina sp. KQZ13P-5]|nr:TRAP transporter large permease subunit [Micropruina sp. KQZ13P-5]
MAGGRCAGPGWPRTGSPFRASGRPDPPDALQRGACTGYRFSPIAIQYGISPIHFGVLMVFTMCIAVISPPSAPVLYVGARTAGLKVEDVITPLMPFFLALIGMLLIIRGRGTRGRHLLLSPAESFAPGVPARRPL